MVGSAAKSRLESGGLSFWRDANQAASPELIVSGSAEVRRTAVVSLPPTRSRSWWDCH